jgi:hypothetical protein
VKRTKQALTLPDCFGWHTACETCDGVPDNPEPAAAPCATREGCRAIVRFVGGESLRDAETITAALALWPPHKIVRYLAGHFEADHEGNANAKRKREIERATTYRPTDPKFAEALTVIDAIVARCVRDAEKHLVDNGERHKRSGAAYLRWHANNSALFREVRKGRFKDRTIAKVIPHAHSASCIVRVYTGAFEEAYSLDPPRGVPCRIWIDKYPMVTLVGVTPETARDAGSWLARVMAADLIGKQQ